MKIFHQPKKFPRIITLLLVLITGGIITAQIIPSFFQARNIILDGYKGEKAKEISEVLERTKRLNLLTLETKNLINAIKKIDPSIESILITKSFPQTLKITVKHQEPFAEIIVNPAAVALLEEQLFKTATISATESTDSAYNNSKNDQSERIIMNNHGGKMNFTETSGLLTILIQSPPKDEREILDPASFKTVSTLVGNLKAADIKFGKIAILNNQMFVVEYAEDSFVLFASEQDIGKQVRSLQAMLERFTIEGIKPKKIDLRFTKPVVVF